LNRATSFNQASSDRPLRDLAERLLGRATMLRKKNAAAWLEYGYVLRKRGGAQVDAQRAIGRALSLTDEYPDSTPKPLLAEISFLRARYLQDLVDRFRDLKDGSGLGVFTPSCSALGAFCENYVHPAHFNDQLKDAPSIDLDVQGRREQMIAFYRRAVEANPELVEAAERYGRELALAGEWEELGVLAREQTERGKEPAFFMTVQAMALERLHSDGEADSLFRNAIPQLPDSVRRWFEKPPAGLDTIADFWRRARPLWITPFNELQLEHWARVAYAMLVLRDREADVSGPDTPQGDAIIRYGWPTMITQVERDAGRILSFAGQTAAEYFLSCPPADVDKEHKSCVLPGVEGTGRDQSGGRWLFWTYAMDRPSMVFEVRPGTRVPRYLREGAAEDYARQLRATTPLAFSSRLAPTILSLPVQVARFRGEREDHTAFGIFSLVPAEQMGASATDSIATGFFVFRDTTGLPMISRHTKTLPAGDAKLSYWFFGPADRYALSLEAYVPTRATAATARDTLVAPIWFRDSLLVSDLLVAHNVALRGDTIPASWRDLDIAASATLAFMPGSTVWVVWEVYGLPVTTAGTAKYDVTVALRDARARGLPLRLLQRLGIGRRAAPATAIQWTAEHRAASDGRVLDYVALQLPEDIAGNYEVLVTVTDPTTRRAVSVRRALTITKP
jgi:tetratricopeptide (TPR) repeat protein